MKGPREIAAGVYCLAVRGTNVYFVRSGPEWVLIDACWAASGRAIHRAAESLFGPLRPAAILLTHAHPDHQGSAAQLARRWGSPVYVQAADLPLLLGDAPETDPIGRVFVALTRPLPQRVRERLSSSQFTRFADIARPLPDSAEVPGLPDWQRVPTPGHSPGHVVFFRPGDRVAIVGDAVLTASRWSLWGLLPGKQCLWPPMRAASWDWRRTKESVATLAQLEPRVLASGHGTPMAGAGVADELRAFCARFAPTAAMNPLHGRD